MELQIWNSQTSQQMKKGFLRMVLKTDDCGTLLTHSVRE